MGELAQDQLPECAPRPQADGDRQVACRVRDFKRMDAQSLEQPPAEVEGSVVAAVHKMQARGQRQAEESLRQDGRQRQ